MMIRNPVTRRAGATMLETAVILPVTFLFFLGLIVGGMGIFRYQEVAFLAREGARYAAVRGMTFEAEHPGQTAATPEDVFNNAILPRVVSLDQNNLSYTVTWDKNNYPYSITDNYEKPVANTVTVTVTYQWFPEVFLAGPITLTSSSTIPMCY
jgi:Flp pilus assembly protein TadG